MSISTELKITLMRSRLLFVALLLCCAGFVYGQRAEMPDSLFQIQDTVLIPTKSGIPLSAIIVRKKGLDKPLPAILFYTTYLGPKDALVAKRAAQRDYVGLVVYARGIRQNLHDYMPFEHESQDLYDVIDWISKQAWCNGALGMFGGSYTGFAQWAAIKHRHPALKTIVPQVAVMPGFDMPMENNVPIGNILSWSHDNIYKLPPLRRGLMFDWFEQGLAFRQLDSLAGQRNPIFQKWLQHPAYDTYWQNMVPTAAEYAQLDIPVLTTTGYYDGSQLSAMQYFKLHQRYHKNPKHYLVIGPYDHWGGQRNASPELMGYQIDAVAHQNMGDLAYEWLDYILKQQPKPALLKDNINFQVMGSNQWKHASSLAEMSNAQLVFYLNKDNLTAEKPKKQDYRTQKVDFRDRVNQNNFYTPQLIFDSLDVSSGLVFTTPVFDHEFSITGTFSAALSAAINKKDMDVSLALYEKTKAGKYFFLTRYVGRASYAQNPAQRKLLKKNVKTVIPVNHTRLVAKKIERGSQLLILLNVNKHPFEVVNYGSGKEVSDETLNDAGIPLQIKWYNDSFIKIPIFKTAD